MLAAVLVFSASSSWSAHAAAAGSGTGKDKLVLLQNSKTIIHNGTAYQAVQALSEQNGVTYVPLRTMAEQLYSNLAYDASTKEYVVSYGQSQLRYSIGKAGYLYNGEYRNDVLGTPYLLNGSLMIPVRTLLKPYGMTLALNKEAKTIELAWYVKPIAEFTVSPGTIYEGETEVAYMSKPRHPLHLGIIDEKWEGKQQVFDSKGTYTVTHWVEDTNGVWSDPYSVVVKVERLNQPPEALFETNKAVYQMGEPITYTNKSFDEEDGTVLTESWSNKADAFFEPGEQTISLTVTDSKGLQSTYDQTITISNTTMYTKPEFDLLFTKQGDKIAVDGAGVLTLPVITYASLNNYGQQTLIRDNAPETITEEGVYYTDTANGNVRLFGHHQNERDNAVRTYIVVTNNNKQDATLTVDRTGIGGPSTAAGAGKTAGNNYLNARTKPSLNQKTVIPAGQSRLVLPELSNKSINPGQIITYYADVNTTAPLKFSIVIVDKDKDPLAALPNLPVLPYDGKHSRGTFELANRTINISDTIGGKPSRMVLTDNKLDLFMSGIDSVSGNQMTNTGNYGMMYIITLRQVLPHTLIAINPRGGFYAGSFLINNKMVYAPNSGVLATSSEAGVLYRTGDNSETVTIAFTPASGSNLPISFLFLPLPDKK
ncbi:stalk domain-containing protein [Paenibacillus protaetiae]|nr:stalk domain-containing protein [Paenibacillus protaetiae]